MSILKHFVEMLNDFQLDFDLRPTNSSMFKELILN